MQQEIPCICDRYICTILKRKYYFNLITSGTTQVHCAHVHTIHCITLNTLNTVLACLKL